MREDKKKINLNFSRMKKNVLRKEKIFLKICPKNYPKKGGKKKWLRGKSGARTGGGGGLAYFVKGGPPKTFFFFGVNGAKGLCGGGVSH